jgi:ribose/xylose/arabinose/galactoside ABC-type transport system permease subunit
MSMQASKPIEAQLKAPGQRGFGYRLLNKPELAGGVGIVLCFILFSTLDASMARPDNIARILTTASYMGFAACGMMFLMMAKEIDLASGAIAGLCSGLAGYLVVVSGLPEWAGLLAGLVAAVAIGLLNSFVTLKIGMPSFFATLGASFLLQGLVTWLLQGHWYIVSDKMPFLGLLGSASPIFGLSWNVILFLLLMLLGDLTVRWTKIGAILAATGGNKRAAQAAGINTSLVKTCCFVFVAICSYFGGCMVMNATNTVDGGTGAEWGLWVIAGAIIGGSSLNGGVGSMLGVLLGVVLIQIIKSGLGAAHIQTNAQGLVVGAILIAAAALDVIRRKAKKY